MHASVTSQPRLLSVVTQLESGGAQTVAIELHREFLSRGVASKLVFLYEKDKSAFPRRDYETLLDHRWASPADFIRITARLRAAWREFRPSCVIAHTHFTNNLCAFVGPTTGVRAKLLPVHHNVFESYPASSRTLDRFARQAKLYDCEISVSEPVLASLPGHGTQGRHRVILNGQSLARSVMDRTAARAAFGLPADALIAGNIGRLAEQKNQGFLVDLLARVPGLYVAILGEGHLREALTAQARGLGVQDRLILLGTVVHERVPDFLRALDIFAMPSLHEGMSIAMLEALAAGIPFLGSDVPTIRTVIDGGGGGAGIALPLDLDRWVEAVDGLRSPAAWTALSTREQARAADFSVETMADQYLAAAGASAD